MNSQKGLNMQIKLISKICLVAFFLFILNGCSSKKHTNNFHPPKDYKNKYFAENRHDSFQDDEDFIAYKKSLSSGFKSFLNNDIFVSSEYNYTRQKRGSYSRFKDMMKYKRSRR